VKESGVSAIDRLETLTTHWFSAAQEALDTPTLSETLTRLPVEPMSPARQMLFESKSPEKPENTVLNTKTGNNIQDNGAQYNKLLRDGWTRVGNELIPPQAGTTTPGRIPLTRSQGTPTVRPQQVAETHVPRPISQRPVGLFGPLFSPVKSPKNP
jgi:hypothetical protein